MPDDFDVFLDTAVGDTRDPYPGYARARAETPVAEEEVFGARVYTVYRHADVERVLRDPDTFSSSVYAEGMGLVMGPTILQMDAPGHRGRRALVAGSFRRATLGRWERELIAPTVHALIDDFIDAGEVDLVPAFCARLPFRVIARILGIPVDDEDRFARLSIELVSIAADYERGMEASRQLGGYFTGVLEDKRRSPGDDVISGLAAAQVVDPSLTDDEILGFLRLLLPAGAETTYRLLGTLLFALLSEPGRYERVRSERALLPAAIEESLRWEAPVQFVSRSPVVDVAIAGHAIPAGANVGLALGSANRDETVFTDPDVFDIDRGGTAHLAFAEGPHRCLGEHLARLEVTVALGAIFDRLHAVRLVDDGRDPHVRGESFRSPTCLPVRFGSS